MSLVKGNDTLLFSYDQGGNVISVNYNGTDYYYLRNGQNDIVKLIDGSGSTVVEYSYNSWGEQTGCTGTLSTALGTLNPFRYRGYVYDEETGLYYLQSRYYDPDLCRFISADVYLSTGQGVLGCNAFAYCGNEPCGRLDVAGEDWIDILIWILDTDEQITKDLKNFTSQFDFSISQGFAGNATFGAIDDVQAICVSIGTNGDFAVQLQPATIGGTTGTPGASFVATTSFMHCTVPDLNGIGRSLGVSVFTEYYGLGGGFDINETLGDVKHHGITLSAGIGVPSAELHVNYGNTKQLYFTNLYDVKLSAISNIRKLIEIYERSN